MRFTPTSPYILIFSAVFLNCAHVINAFSFRCHKHSSAFVKRITVSQKEPFSINEKPSVLSAHSVSRDVDDLVSRRRALTQGAGALSALFIGKELTNAKPASASSVAAAIRPPPGSQSLAQSAASAAINAEQTSQKAWTKLTVGATGAAAIISDALSHNKALSTTTSSESIGKRAASAVIEKQSKITLIKKLKVMVRTFQRAVLISCLAAPLVITFPFAKRSPKSFEKWLQFFLRQSERGGAVIIKMCQWASSRPDVFGTHFCDVTKKLQDGTTPHAWSHTVKILQTSYGMKWKDHVYVDQNHVLGSGCMAQVYKGTITEDDGTTRDVAIKVLHPGVRDGIEHDLNLLRCFAHIMERLPFGYGEIMKWNNMSGMVEEFANMLLPQLDLRNEARNIRKFNENFKDYPHVVFPKLIPGYESHPDILVESFCEGTPVEQFVREHDPSNAEEKFLREVACDRAAHIMCTMIFEHNFVHGDLHPGNILIDKDNKMVLLDCGIVSEYDDADHDLLVNIVAAFIRMDGRKAAELMADDSNKRLHEAGESTKNVDAYISDIEDLSKTPRESDFLFEKIGTYCNYIFNAAATHHVKMNPIFISMALAIKVQEGVALMLNPACKLMKIANPIILKCEAKRFNKGMGERVMQYAEDTMRNMRLKLDRESS
mmetsp:Transcript_23348/g.32711  ORF Transcript_23348/g.32711 Transcript_23348/m.32711 type:complete len:659 (-) Transcript_23348:140-2116(-)